MKTRRTFIFDDRRDADLLAFLDAMPNRSLYIREALREKQERETASPNITLRDVWLRLAALEERLADGVVAPAAPAIPDDIQLNLKQLGL